MNRRECPRERFPLGGTLPQTKMEMGNPQFAGENCLRGLNPKGSSNDDTPNKITDARLAARFTEASDDER